MRTSQHPGGERGGFVGFSDPRYRRKLGASLAAVGVCALVNLEFTPWLPWWTVVALACFFSLLFDYDDAKLRVLSREGALPDEVGTAVRGQRHVADANRLRVAVEDLAARLTDEQRQLLGDVLGPVRSLEGKVEALVQKGAEVDAELRLHDPAEAERELVAARQRAEELEPGPRRAEEEATVGVLQAQLDTLERVQVRRARIDAQLRTSVAMMSALHLDLVEMLSSDREGSATALRRVGEQVRQVSRGVDAIASALDEVQFEGAPAARPSASRHAGRRRTRD